MHLNNKLKRAQRRPSLQQTNSGNYILKNITIQSGNGCKWMLKFTIKLCIQQYLCTFTTDLWFPLPALNHTTGAEQRNQLILTIYSTVIRTFSKPAHRITEISILFKLQRQRKTQSGITGEKIIINENN